MPPPDTGARLEAIRQALRVAIKELSLRGVARQVGLSPMGLSNFIKGPRKPYPATRHKLTLWYAEHGAKYGPSDETARAALDVLLDGLPERGREKGKDAVLVVIEQLHRESRTQPPAWLTALKDDEPAG